MGAEKPGFVYLQVINQQINIISSHPNDAPGTLVVPVHPLVEIKLDNVPAKGRVEVYPNSHIEVIFNELKAERSVELAVSKDKMSVQLIARYTNGTKISLPYTEPTKMLTLRIREDTVSPELFQRSEIESLLQEKGIVFGIDWGEIQRFIESGVSGQCTCAIGKWPIETIPERYEILVEKAAEPTMIGIVKVQPILTVRANELVASHQQAMDGVPGMDVYGQLIPPASVKARLPRVGKGLEESQDGLVRSTRGGRVIVTPKLLDVANTLTIDNSLSVADGHVQFEGDIVIRGNVNESVEITAGGQVFVTGFVSQATIIADGGVIVSGGIFQSTITAGTRLTVLNELKQMLIGLQDEFSQFVLAAEQLHDALGIRATLFGAGKIAATLLQEKFTHILRWPRMVLDWKQANGAIVSGTWTNWLDQIAFELSQNKLLAARDIFAWKFLLKEIESTLGEIPGQEEIEVNVQVKNAQRSTVESSGRIICVGQGFYQCKLKAHRDIEAVGAPGVILGCEVTCGNHVTAREIGSQAESTTVVHIQSKEGQVKANCIHPGTLLTVGPWSHKVIKEMRDANWP